MLLYSFIFKYYPDVLMPIALDKLRTKVKADAVICTLGASVWGIFVICIKDVAMWSRFSRGWGWIRPDE